MAKRHLDRTVYDTLREAARELIVSAGGLERAAERTRVSKSTLAAYYDPHAQVFMPIDIVADLEATTRDLPVSRRLARLKDVFICEIPQFDGEEMIAHLANVADRIGQVFRESSIAIENAQTLEPPECARLRDSIYDCFQSLLVLENGLNHQAKEADKAGK